MKTIIAGSRTISDPRIVLKAINDSGFLITRIISGGAKGIDTAAIYVAGLMDLPYPDIHYADWSLIGKGAGILRNKKMADNADALIAIWDGESPGTKNMIETARKHGLRVYVHDASNYHSQGS